MLTSVLDGQLLAERHGSARPHVLALHGWGRTRSDWARALKNCDGLALDLPGFGITSPPTKPWGSPDYAHQLLPLMDELDPAILVGHSFGGRVAVHMAAARPEAMGGLVLTGAPLARIGSPRKPALGFRVKRRLRALGLVSEASIERARQRHGAADYRATSGVMREIFVRIVNEGYDDVLAQLNRATFPVHLVWGEADTEVPVAVAEKIVTAIPRSTLHVVPGSGHLLDAALSAKINAVVAVLGGTAGADTPGAVAPGAATSGADMPSTDAQPAIDKPQAAQ